MNSIQLFLGGGSTQSTDRLHPRWHAVGIQNCLDWSSILPCTCRNQQEQELQDALTLVLLDDVCRSES